MICNKRNTRVICMVVALFSGVLSKDEPSLTWFEAQRRCQGRGGLTTKTTGISQKYYWTGSYIRLSPWTKILGCYPDFYITNHREQIERKMDTKSVGSCQETCKRHNSTTFAIKLNRCICFEGHVNFVNMSKYSPSLCNYSCDSLNGIYSRECGGETTYNVFISDEGASFETYGDNHNCLSLECSDLNPSYKADNCAIPLDKICRNATSKEENAIGWNSSMELCKRTNPPSYLYGNLNLTNANGSCETLPNGKSQVRWLGIARQKYMMEDQGWATEDIEKKYFLLCQKCKKRDECTFSKCNDTTQNETYCLDKTTAELTTTNEPFTTKQTSITPNNQMSTDIDSITTPRKQNVSVESYPATTSLTTQLKKHQMKDTDDTDDTVLIISIVLGIVFSATAIALVVLYLRRSRLRSERNNKNPQKQDGVSSATYPEAGSQHEESYFVIEKPSFYELADSSGINSEDPYNETEEGEYDHLRNKDSRKKIADDTYQHATPGTKGDVSNYDSTTAFQNRDLTNTGRIITESKHGKLPKLERINSTYSEVANPSQDAYFVLEKASSYELADNSVLDSESPYNETEEGDYDQLRNKDSRKKDIDDTYHHATFDNKGDMSDYDTSNTDQTQELEGAYDHMHDSLNLQRNSDYGYNFIDPNIKH